MKKAFLSVGFILAFFILTGTVNAQNKVVFPVKYQPDTRIDNMGYWRLMAEYGFVPVQPYSKVPAAKIAGSKIIARGIAFDDSPDVPVTTEASTQSENSIVVDPNNKAILLNSNNSTQYPSTGSLYGADYLTSSDEGQTWGGSVAGAGGGNSGDPAACINLNGRYFIGFIDNANGQSVAYSDNQGTTWTVSKAGSGTLFDMCDKNHLWVDNSPTSPHKGNLYDGWMKSNQIQVVRSTTNGTSWTTPVSVSNATNAGSHNQGVNFKTGPDGEVYAVWSVYDSWPGDEKALGFAKSLDGGATWQPAVRALNNIRGIRTTGVTQNQRTNSFPSMAVDISNSPYRGTIYVVWTNIGVPGTNTGNSSDVYLIKSTDEGVTWTAPMQINSDATGAGKQHYFPWISCDQANGTLSIVFYDNRNVASNMAEAWMAYSMDGGDTWEDMKVSDVSFTPTPIPNLATGYFGDYLAIDSYNGMVYPTWTDNRSGHAMTYVSPIELITPVSAVVYESYNLNDTTFGNANGLMDYGETELLGLKLKNTGNVEADSVTVFLSTNSPWINISDNQEYYGNFVPGQVVSILNGFKFSVSDSIPDNIPVIFTVAAVDKLDSATFSTFQIFSHAPQVTIMGLTISDPAGNNNGRLDPGESAILNINTMNTGDWDAQDVISNLTSGNPYLTIQAGTFPIGTMTPGQSVNATFPVTVNPGAAIGSAATVHNTATSLLQAVQKTFNLRIGLIVEDWETGNFLKFPWQLSGNADWTIDGTVKWEGNYSAKSGDIGDNQVSDLSITYHVMMDDSISFYRKVSSEAIYDKLKFYIDGMMVGQWSGNQDWKRVAFPVTAGAHTFKWSYEKDAQTSAFQDCAWVDFIVFPPEYRTTASAGNDGYVCTGDQFQMQGLAVNYDSLRWSTSGDGSFDNEAILNALYTPGPNDITTGQATITLTAYGMNSVVITDAMTLEVWGANGANAGGNGVMCSGQNKFSLTNATASGSSAIQKSWLSRGDGTFSDNTQLNPDYFPGPADILNGSVRLILTVTSDCPAATDSMELTVNPSPVVNIGPDTAVCANLSILLDATTPEAVSYLWHPSLATTPTLVADSSGTGIGQRLFSVLVTDDKGCNGIDTVTITFKDCTGIGEPEGIAIQVFPNPSAGIFTIEITTARQEVLKARIIDANGREVYSKDRIVARGSVSETVDVAHLNSGNYFLEISNGSGKLIRKILIRK
jgi:hypothetical protein